MLRANARLSLAEFTSNRADIGTHVGSDCANFDADYVADFSDIGPDIGSRWQRSD